jgi:hypothetical protein
VIHSQLPLFFNIKKRQIKMIQNSLVRIDFSLRTDITLRQGDESFLNNKLEQLRMLDRRGW